MTVGLPGIAKLPGARREGFEMLIAALRKCAGENLLSLSAFGGWVVGDPFFADEPASSAAVFRTVDLKTLDLLAQSGNMLGKHRIRAPLVMTPDYVASSCDVFPLELIEIKQLHVPVFGDDYFADRSFDAHHLRLQCERELKSELIQLRQGLLAAAGRHNLLDDLTHTCAARTMRILRGILELTKAESTASHASELAANAASATGCKLDALSAVIQSNGAAGYEGFERFYAEIESLSGFVDGLPDVA